jgi:hypothetical protein
MSSIGSRFKLLGLCMLALCGLTALMAASAQGNWLENGVAITVNKPLKLKAHTPVNFLISANNIEYKCTTLASEELNLLVGTSTTATAEGGAAFSGCTAFSKGVEQPNCKPENQPINFRGLWLVKLLALTKGGTLLNVALLEQINSLTPLGTIKLSAKCALEETTKITGSLVFECGKLEPVNTFVQEDCSVSRTVHLLQAPAQTEWFQGKEDAEVVKDEIKFGSAKATLDGIIAAELVSGNPWGGEV